MYAPHPPYQDHDPQPWPSTPPTWPPAAPASEPAWGPPPRPPRRSHRSWRWLVIVLALLTGLLVTPLAEPVWREVRAAVPGLSTVVGRADPTVAAPAGWEEAVAAVDPGVVTIETRTRAGIGAGTGMVLSADGRVLTNHHVIDGAQRIQVTVATTGDTYDATVIGSSADHDVAVLQLEGAADLATIPIGDPDELEIGDAVAAVGNAGGLGGLPSVASGTVIGLNRTVTAADADGSDVERLGGMIAVRADVQPGDSGGPLITSTGAVVGMTTAASITGQGRTQRSLSQYGYAIPIDTALAIAEQLF